MFILGIIPARGGSQGIIDKNIHLLCGKPMIEYTINAADKSTLDDWFVFTDKYTQYRTYGIVRPPEMAGGGKDSIYIWLPYCVEEYEKITGNHVDVIMILQPTSPLRIAQDITKAIECFYDNQAIDVDSLYSGYYFPLKTKDKRHNKACDKPHFQRNGAIFILKPELLKQNKIWSSEAIEFCMPKTRSIDVDDMEDMYMCESIIKNGGLDYGHC